MRLLRYNSDHEISLTEVLHDGEVPRYAILSHTWGADSDEVTLADLQTGQGQSKLGYEKIRFCSEQARRDGFEYFWVDTCCINRADLVELSEAIVSMFRWYRNAEKCYVYLADVSTGQNNVETDTHSTWALTFHGSRWFTRGWTLQELLAPTVVEFFSQEGHCLGTKNSLAHQIHTITSIPLAALYGAPLSQFSVTEQLRWAQGRQTKKKEDKAYCLLGMFDVFMPLLYGEGDNAFRRLEKAIHKRLGANVGTSVSNSHEAYNSISRITSATDRSASTTPGNQNLELFQKRAPLLKIQNEESLYKSFQHYKYEKVHQHHILEQHQGTGSWLEAHNTYRSWASSSSDGRCILYFSGEKGCGKTVSVSSMIAKLQIGFQNNTTPKAVILYSSYSRQHNSTSSSMLCVMIHQLVTQLPKLRTVLYDRYRSISPAVSKHYRRPTAQLWWVLQELLKNATEVQTLYMVLDGFDQLSRDSQHQMLKESKSCPLPIKYLIAGRELSDAKLLATALFQDQGLLSLELDLNEDNEAISAVNRDIDKYAYMTLFTTQHFAFLSHVDKAKAFETVRRHQSATFLATKLILDIIAVKREVDPLLSVPLSRTPIKCDVIFVELFRELQRLHGVRLDLVFRYMLFGFEELTIDEMVYANNSREKANSNDVGDDLQWRLSQSRPLIAVGERSRHVAFCHPSARETLLQLLNDSTIQSTRSLDEQLCHQAFAVECLTRLLHTGNLGLPEIWRKDYMRQKEEAINRHPLLRYAMKYWYQHLHAACSARLASNETVDELRDVLRHLAKFWLQSDEESVTLRHLMIELSGVQYLKNIQIFSPFELSCALGLTGIVQELLDSKMNSKRFEVRITAALSAAIRGGHESTVKMLIEQYSIISLNGNAYSDILQATVRQDRPELFNLVLKLRKRDADELDSALSAAIQTANAGMFNRLTEEIDAQEKLKPITTPLHSMFRSEVKPTPRTIKEAILKIHALVTDGNVDVNALEPRMGNTALLLACWFDFDTEIIKTLIELGADPKLPNRYGWTPLHLAARYNREGSTVKVLLRLGGSELVGLLTNGGNSPLHWAAEAGVPSIEHRFEAAAQLLDAGADPNLLNDIGISPKRLAPTLPEGTRRLGLPFVKAIRAKDVSQSTRLIGIGARKPQICDPSSNSELDLESRRELTDALSNLPYVDSDPDFERTIDD